MTTSEPNNTGKKPSSRPISSSREQRLLDAALMGRVAGDEPGAMEEFYDRFSPLVFRLSTQSMPTRAEAEDAVQEVFVRLWRTADRFDPDKAALVTWVLLLTRRHLVDRMRRASVRPKTRPMTAASGDEGGPNAGTDTDNPLGIDFALIQDEQLRATFKRVGTLPELQRIVVQRAYLGGQTLRQISMELDTPLGTVKSALSRVLSRLREWAAEVDPADRGPTTGL